MSSMLDNISRVLEAGLDVLMEGEPDDGFSLDDIKEARRAVRIFFSDEEASEARALLREELFKQAMDQEINYSKDMPAAILTTLASRADYYAQLALEEWSRLDRKADRAI